MSVAVKTTNTANQTIPVLDMQDFNAGNNRAEFTRAFGTALTETGFVVIENHTVPHIEITRAYEGSRKLFRLPNLHRYQREDIHFQRGYTPFGMEGAKASHEGDLKASWFTGAEYSPTNRARNHEWSHDNVWPHELPELRSQLVPIFNDLNSFFFTLLSVTDDFLGFTDRRLVRTSEEGPSLLRSIYYPRVENPDNRLRSAPHEDINLLTVLPRATTAGLKIKTRDGIWIEPPLVHNSITVNAADMLQYLTNGQIVSATHQVSNEGIATDERYSLVFFGHPRGEMVLDKSGKTAAEFLQERLRDIGVSNEGRVKKIA